jgi:hypothetical protein
MFYGEFSDSRPTPKLGTTHYWLPATSYSIYLQLPSISVARIGEKKNAYRVFVGKPEGKRPLGRPRLRWRDRIKMDFGEVGSGGMD